MNSATVFDNTFVRGLPLVVEETIVNHFKYPILISSVCFSQTINYEVTFFVRNEIPVFLDGRIDNRIAGKLASKTANVWNKTVLKTIDVLGINLFIG